MQHIYCSGLGLGEEFSCLGIKEFLKRLNHGAGPGTVVGCGNITGFHQGVVGSVSLGSGSVAQYSMKGGAGSTVMAVVGAALGGGTEAGSLVMSGSLTIGAGAGTGSVAIMGGAMASSCLMKSCKVTQPTSIR